MALIHNHKGLKKFDLSDSTAGIKQDHAPRLRRVLSLLKVSDEPSAMNLPGYRLHALKGDWKGYWSIDVSGNWRIYFKFQDGDVLLEYLDPH